MLSYELVPIILFVPSVQVIGLSATNGFIESLNQTQYRFTPNPEFNGTVDLNYVVTDNNGGNFLAPDAPFGGYKHSGIGREMGPEGFEEYLETKTIAIKVEA